MSRILDTNLPLISNIENLMASDDEDRAEQSQQLIDEYQAAAPEVKKILDNCFIALCGYSLETLLREQGVNEEQVKYCANCDFINDSDGPCWHCGSKKTVMHTP